MGLLEPAVPKAGMTVSGQRPSWRPQTGFDVGAGGDMTPVRPRQWRIRCHDVADRERFLTVLVDRDRVVLAGPPGEAAVLTATQLNQLRAALQDAANEADK